MLLVPEIRRLLHLLLHLALHRGNLLPHERQCVLHRSAHQWRVQPTLQAVDLLLRHLLQHLNPPHPGLQLAHLSEGRCPRQGVLRVADVGDERGIGLVRLVRVKRLLAYAAMRAGLARLTTTTCPASRRLSANAAPYTSCVSRQAGIRFTLCLLMPECSASKPATVMAKRR